MLPGLTAADVILSRNEIYLARENDFYCSFVDWRVFGRVRVISGFTVKPFFEKWKWSEVIRKNLKE